MKFEAILWKLRLNIIFKGQTKLHSQEIEMHQRRFSLNWHYKRMHCEYNDYYNDDNGGDDNDDNDNDDDDNDDKGDRKVQEHW